MCAHTISVIIPAYNAQDTLGACLQALASQTIPPDCYEVIVVDDGSTDDTAAVARRNGVRVISQANAGPAAARNRGAQEAQGEILLFTDADCAPAADWIERMVAPFDDPGVSGAKGIYRTRQREWVARFVQAEYEDKYTRMLNQERIDFVDTYSAAYRRDVFVANGGFDPLFATASVEDQELSFRLARKGYRLVMRPDAAVYHQHDTTIGQYWRRKLGIGYWKTLLLRWHPERVVRDSHTPQVLKLQIVLLGLLIALLGLTPFSQLARWSALVTGGLFCLTTLPFIVRLRRRDPPLVLIGLPMLALRALALGCGLLLGMSRFATRPSPRPAPIGGLNRLLKRTIDVVGSLIGLTFSLPLIAVLGAAVKLDSSGPAFFVQERAGLNGRPFRMLKLRSMIDGADELVDSPSAHVKRPDDPRITRVGHWLRRTSLDELPQFWNVLKGQMSLVGPRPEELCVVQEYTDWQRQRLAVQPGMTGPMQINGRAELPLDERVRLELEYIENYTLWKDIAILAKTMIAILQGRGAY